MRPCKGIVVPLVVLLGLAISSPTRAEEYDVPSLDHLTLQEAVDAAALSADARNTINIIDSPIFTVGEVRIGEEFGPDRRLTIRPGPGLDRATVASLNGAEPIFSLLGGWGGSHVKIQDLDIVRSSTNANHLVMIWNYSEVVLERCRIGSVWNSIGAPGFHNLFIGYPTAVVVRNCIFFSYLPGNFHTGIRAQNFGDPGNSLYLYNNVVADHYAYGIHMTGGLAGALMLLRNNVVVNHPGAPIEPFAFGSEVDDFPRVITSHNVAFAGAAAVEELGLAGAAQSISGEGEADFLRFDRDDSDDAFDETTWIVVPAWDPNADFFRLTDGGPLHDEDSDWGVTVRDHDPDDEDIAVRNDIEKDPRPGAGHTDRGADQIEPGAGEGAGLAGLEDLVREGRLRRGIERSLLAKIEAAEAAVYREEFKAAANQMRAFMNQVRALRGRRIRVDTAEVLLEAAQEIRDDLLR